MEIDAVCTIRGSNTTDWHVMIFNIHKLCQHIAAAYRDYAIAVTVICRFDRCNPTGTIETTGMAEGVRSVEVDTNSRAISCDRDRAANARANFHRSL